MDEIDAQDGTLSCTGDIQAEKAYDDSQNKVEDKSHDEACLSTDDKEDSHNIMKLM